MHRLKILDYRHFFDPSPHRQQVGSATLPQGESDYTESVARFTKTKTYRGYGDLLAFEAIQYFTKFALANLK